MKASKKEWSVVPAALLILFALELALSAASHSLLWEIGKPDNNNAEFALAPNQYQTFKEDGFFVVGRSDPKRDWREKPLTVTSCVIVNKLKL